MLYLILKLEGYTVRFAGGRFVREIKKPESNYLIRSFTYI